MDPRFEKIQQSPENDIFKVVFYPDRIYHAQYLNATRSRRYRYNVQEVRGKLDILVLKGEVYMDGGFLTHFIRVEYRPARLVELAREQGRLVRSQVGAWVRITRADGAQAESEIRLHYDRWIDAYQAEVWGTLDPPRSTRHDYAVLDLLGRHGQITRIPQFSPMLEEIKQVRRVELAFRESQTERPTGLPVDNVQWDNNFLSSHQEPRTPEPSSPQNTVEDKNYLLDFQRGWFLQSDEVDPVRYRNAMMDDDNPDRANDNVIEMRWLVQRELGGSVVFFHEVTIPPHTVEGTHRHIGSEELYYITEGEGIAYMAVGDDPATDPLPTVERHIYGIGVRQCKELPVRKGSVIFTKSGGIHGIRNPSDEPLKFVAFLYHSA
jgi:oxalate decarboxylase/phosphoglucose isomerase-like protein (cupin superfamily)